ncbi:MAG: 2-iminobutanoate/2-iminopropanoate deaminase [Luteibaculaceae bacterium]|jgi:2-iminobutanoate/2-iminopropanoate deaminase
MKKSISIPGAPAPIGPYSQAVEVNNTIYISGQIGLDPSTGDWINSSVSAETEQVLKNIKSLIEASGLSMNNVVKCSIFLKDLADFNAVNEVYSTFFSEPFPARECVQVVKLPKDVNVEISAIAARY